MLRLATTVCVTLALLATVATGCNVYEGLYEEGDSENAEALLEDARIALQQDRPEEAIKHLRKALVYVPDDEPLLRKQIQIKLASAVLEVQEINVLSLKRIADNLNGEATSHDALAFGKSQSQACLFPTHHEQTPFDPTEGIDIDQLGNPASEAALAESRDLVANVFTGTDIFLCSDEGLDQTISSAQQQGLSNGEIAEALVDYAVSVSTTAYVDIVGVGGGNASFFRVTSPAGEDYVSVCFPSEQMCNSTVGQSRAHLDGLDCSTRTLQKRAALLASTSAQELADLARDGYKKAAAGLENECYVH